MPQCDEINKILNMPMVLNIPTFLIWQSSEPGRVLNMRAFHNVLNMSEYALLDRDLNIYRVLIMPVF